MLCCGVGGVTLASLACLALAWIVRIEVAAAEHGLRNVRAIEVGDDHRDDRLSGVDAGVVFFWLYAVLVTARMLARALVLLTALTMSHETHRRGQ